MNAKVNDPSLSFNLSETRLAPFHTNLFVVSDELNVVRGLKRTNRIVSLGSTRHMIGKVGQQMKIHEQILNLTTRHVLITPSCTPG
jgi:hypothetical protein